MSRFFRGLAFVLALVSIQARSEDLPPLSGTELAARMEAVQALRVRRPDLLQSTQGILVRYRLSGSQAEATDIRPGDILASYAGVPLANAESFVSLVGSHASGRTDIELVLIRGEARKTVQIKPGKIGVVVDTVQGMPTVPTEPILRLETGMHTANIGQIAVDRAGRWLATVSQDKTIRVWDLAGGKLAQVLRPPQAAGHEGELYAVAMSPDGEWIVAGGSTATGEYLPSLYLFRRSTGQLVRRIPNLPDRAGSLAWSADGRFLAFGLGATGIRVYRTEDFSLVGEDLKYADQIFGIDFSANGRMITASADGDLRLYQIGASGLARLVRLAPPGGKKPASPRFSPDGTRLAVGFADSAQVPVLDSSTLELRYFSNVEGIGRGTMSSVAWGSDGSLYAGGTYNHETNPNRLIRRWKDGGRGQYQDFPAGNNLIGVLSALPDGGIAFGTSDPAWGVIDHTGRRVHFVTSSLIDMRFNVNEFRLSRDGSVVQFGYEYGSAKYVRFNTAARSVEPGADSGLMPAITEAQGLKVTDWFSEYSPKLNGSVLLPPQFGRSRSLAIEPDGASFVLGTDNKLFRFDKAGRMIWSQSAPAPAWRVNASRDGKLLVAGYGDGTIRWHRMSDGKELLALFPHADQKRWVVWTPSGYYDASPGAEELIGWHVNRGKDAAADFFPASRFRDRFYRPDIIARILSNQDEAEAVRLANAERGGRADSPSVVAADVLPPVVEIVSPADGISTAASNVSLRYRVRTSNDAPVTGVRARVNGQAVNLSGARNLVVQATDGARDIAIPIPAEDSEIQLFAENKNGISTPATVRVKWTGARPARQEDAFKPKLYVLAVGVSKYANASFNLNLAAKDAGDFVTVLQEQKGRLYADVQVKLLTDARATRDNVVDGLDWLKSQVTSRDIGMVFLAGHGINDNNGKYYFVPHNGDPDRLLRTGVPQTDIRDTLNSLAGKAVFFVDTCHSGNVLGTAKTRALGTDVNAFVNELASAENGVVVFTAATGRQFSLEDPAWGNGAFTKAVVEGLRGKADFNKNGKITHKGLDYYVAERVKELTKGKQSPVSIAPAGITDFPIAVAR